MPTPVSAGLRLGVIEPQDAVRNFDERQLLLPSFRWQDVWQEEHQRAFAVAGVMREDVLAIFREGLESKFADAGTLADFRKAVRPALAAKGFWGDVEITDPDTGETRITRFDDRRLQLVYDVNVRQSYAAGKWQRYQLTKKRLPFVLYRTMDDGHVRPAHQAWHNVVLLIDDPWWQTHWPPNGWRCRCHAIQLDQRGVDRLTAAGQKLKLTAPAEDWMPHINPYTGEVKAVPRGVDPGFGYNPGVRNDERDQALAETVLQKVVRSDAYSGAVIAAQAATDMPQVLARRAERFGRWVDDMQAQEAATGQVFTLGMVRPEIVRALESLGEPMQSSAIAVTDRDVDHALRPGTSRGKARAAIALELYKQLPVLISRPVAVLRPTGDRVTGAMIYVIEVAGADGKVLKLFLELDQALSEVVDAQRVKRTLNIVRTASMQMPQALKDAKSFEVIWGVWP